MKLKPRHNSETGENSADTLAKELSVSQTTANILVARGYAAAPAAREYLGLNQVNFSNPYDIAGMSEATDEILQAIKNNLHVTIYSDYDADGVCGCSIFLKKFQELKYKNIDYYVPKREGEGYGLNNAAIKHLKKQGTELLITVDCGISNKKEIAYATSVGMDVIVTDHHNCPPDLPECTLVNPKLGCTNGQENLCGAAVAMKLCQVLGGGSAFNQGMELAAIATIADMVPLLGENKHIVNQGLGLINNKPSREMQTFVKTITGKDSIDSEDIAFKLGPVINAAGRISTAHIGVDLLSGISKNPLDDAMLMLSQNEERKEIQNTVYQEALQMLSSDDLKNQQCIVLCKKDWPIGVVGIAASKLMKSFGRPVALLGQSEGKIKGSLRSVDGINIFDILCEMDTLFESFGGHSKAAGITLRDGVYDEFKRRFQNTLLTYDNSLFDNTMYYDAVCDAQDLSLGLVRELSNMKPFGQDNPPVNILLKNMTVANYKAIGKDNNHYSAAFRDKTGQVKCTGFFSSLPDTAVKGDMVCDVLIDPKENIWNGYSSVQGLVQGVKGTFTGQEDYLRYIGNIEKEFTASCVQGALSSGSNHYKNASYDDILTSLKESDYSTLIIIEDCASAQDTIQTIGYETLSKIHVCTHTVPVSLMGKNALLLAPKLEKVKSRWYSNIYYISSYNHVQAAETLSKTLQHDIQMIIMDNIYKNKLITKDRLREIYSIIRKSINDNPSVPLLEHYDTLNVTRTEMLIAIDIFKEIGLLKKEDKKYSVAAETTKDIETSKAYKLFS